MYRGSWHDAPAKSGRQLGYYLGTLTRAANRCTWVRGGALLTHCQNLWPKCCSCSAGGTWPTRTRAAGAVKLLCRCFDGHCVFRKPAQQVDCAEQDAAGDDADADNEDTKRPAGHTAAVTAQDHNAAQSICTVLTTLKPGLYVCSTPRVAGALH